MEGRKKLSGSKYRKLTKIKKSKNDAIVMSCRKLDDMFKASNKKCNIYMFYTCVKFYII